MRKLISQFKIELGNLSEMSQEKKHKWLENMNKDCSTALAIKAMQIKTTWRIRLTYVRMAIIKSTNDRKRGGPWRCQAEKWTMRRGENENLMQIVTLGQTPGSLMSSGSLLAYLKHYSLEKCFQARVIPTPAAQ